MRSDYIILLAALTGGPGVVHPQAPPGCSESLPAPAPPPHPTGYARKNPCKSSGNVIFASSVLLITSALGIRSVAPPTRVGL